MKQLYQEYRNLSTKIKKSRIDNAKQSQQRKPNPQGSHQFDEFSFVDFYVWQKQQKIKLQTYRTNAKGKIVGVIFMFHGLNSHIGHGAHLAEFFSHRGLTTVGFDHRGFGRSQGKLGYIDGLKSHLADSMQFIKLVFPMYQNLPIFALGLSMGGMTSYYLTLQNPNLFNGAVLMAPALKNILGGGIVKITGILGSILPSKTKLTKPVYGVGSRNPVITQFVKQDKYSFSQRMSLSTLDMIVSTMDKSPNTFHLYKCPFIIIQGGLDKLVNPEVAFDLYDKSQTKSEDKQLLFYENMWHDIWHEQQIQEIMPKIVEWIAKRIQKHNCHTKQSSNKKQNDVQQIAVSQKQCQQIQKQIEQIDTEIKNSKQDIKQQKEKQIQNQKQLDYNQIEKIEKEET